MRKRGTTPRFNEAQLLFFLEDYKIKSKFTRYTINIKINIG